MNFLIYGVNNPVIVSAIYCGALERSGICEQQISKHLDVDQQHVWCWARTIVENFDYGNCDLLDDDNFRALWYVLIDETCGILLNSLNSCRSKLESEPQDYDAEEAEESEAETDEDFTLLDDMILSPEQYDILYTNASRRSGLQQAVQLWPRAVVPYAIDADFCKREVFNSCNFTFIFFFICC